MIRLTWNHVYFGGASSESTTTFLRPFLSAPSILVSINQAEEQIVVLVHIPGCKIVQKNATCLAGPVPLDTLKVDFKTCLLSKCEFLILQDHSSIEKCPSNHSKNQS